MRSALVLGFGMLLVCGVGTASAYGDGTEDGAPPAEERVCEDAGLLGAAFGLCVAFCEANDCDLAPDAVACERLRDNYAKITGELAFPCEQGDPEEPL